MREVTKQIPANMEQYLFRPAHKPRTKNRGSEPSVPTMPNATAVQESQTRGALNHFAEPHIDDKKETNMQKHGLPSLRTMNEISTVIKNTHVGVLLQQL